MSTLIVVNDTLLSNLREHRRLWGILAAFVVANSGRTKHLVSWCKFVESSSGPRSRSGRSGLEDDDDDEGDDDEDVDDDDDGDDDGDDEG